MGKDPCGTPLADAAASLPPAPEICRYALKLPWQLQKNFSHSASCSSPGFCRAGRFSRVLALRSTPTGDALSQQRQAPISTRYQGRCSQEQFLTFWKAKQRPQFLQLPTQNHRIKQQQLSNPCQQVPRKQEGPVWGCNSYSLLPGSCWLTRMTFNPSPLEHCTFSTLLPHTHISWLWPGLPGNNCKPSLPSSTASPVQILIE